MDLKVLEKLFRGFQWAAFPRSCVHIMEPGSGRHRKAFTKEPMAGGGLQRGLSSTPDALPNRHLQTLCKQIQFIFLKNLSNKSYYKSLIPSENQKIGEVHI